MRSTAISAKKMEKSSHPVYNLLTCESNVSLLKTWVMGRERDRRRFWLLVFREVGQTSEEEGKEQLREGWDREAGPDLISPTGKLMATNLINVNQQFPCSSARAICSYTWSLGRPTRPLVWKLVCIPTTSQYVRLCTVGSWGPGDFKPLKRGALGDSSLLQFLPAAGCICEPGN